MRIPRRLTTAVAAVAAMAVLPAAAHGAVTGNFVGKTEQPPLSFAADLETNSYPLNIQVLRGRIIGIYGMIRMECPETAILDRQIPSVGHRGIALSRGGGFSFTKDGISMQGHIGKRAGSGHLQGRVDGCEMTGVVWNVAKNHV
jgi:hypothetical protein